MTNYQSEEKILLQPENMIRLYAGGAFPMADEEDTIHWYYPRIRTIIPLDNFNIPRSLRKYLSGEPFEYTFDTETMKVVEACASRDETWISRKLIKAYARIQKLGFLHSVEVRDNGKLVGGLYGVSVNGLFFGESMFSEKPQASKTALVKLIEHLNKKQFTLLDVQYITEHLKMFGAKEISIESYDELRLAGLSLNTSF